MMRWWHVVVLALLLGGCAVDSGIRSDAQVASFFELFPEAVYAESTLTDVSGMADILMTECGRVPAAPVTRGVATAPAARLVAYAKDGEVICVSTKLNDESFAVLKGDSPPTPDTLITVNGAPITSQDLAAEAAAFPPELSAQLRPGDILNRRVNDLLIEQAAERVAIDPAEIDAALEAAWQGRTVSLEAFARELEATNTTIEEFRKQLRKSLQVEAYLYQEGVLTEFDENMLRTYYRQHPDEFVISERVRFRQLYVSLANRSYEQAEERLRTALTRLRDGEEFCSIVAEMSDDVESRGRCGEYESPRGIMLPEIEATLFSLYPNETSVQESANGFHIFLVVDRMQAEVVPFESALPLIRQRLLSAIVEERLPILLLKLRAEAEIVDYT